MSRRDRQIASGKRKSSRRGLLKGAFLVLSAESKLPIGRSSNIRRCKA